MSTRSSISLKVNEDTIRTIYCHFDGYLSHNGKILLEHYDTYEKVEALIALGDLSVLGASTECKIGHSFDTPIKGLCIAYERDRGETGCKAATSYMITQALRRHGQAYNYVFRDGNWYMGTSNEILAPEMCIEN